MRRLRQSIQQLPNLLGSDFSFLLHQTAAGKPSLPYRITRNQLSGFSCGHDCPEGRSQTLNCSPGQSAPQLRAKEKLHCIASDEAQLHLTKHWIQMYPQEIMVILLG